MKGKHFEITVIFGHSRLQATCTTMCEAYDIIRDVDNHTEMLFKRGTSMDEIMEVLVNMSSGRLSAREYPGAMRIRVCDGEV